MQPAISVIIPAFNAQATIAETLQSILNQSFQSFEIILVDDGSTDQTVAVAESILKKGRRPWRMIKHTENKGVSAARNSGLREASGEYVWFVDSDDLADSNFASTLYQIASERGCDIVFCNHRMKNGITGESGESRLDLSDERQYTPEQLLHMFLLDKLYFYIWTMLFKRSFLISARLAFTEGCIYMEDREFIIKALCRCASVHFSRACLYTYVLHGGNTCRSFAEADEKMIKSAADSIEANIRAADYIISHTTSSRLKDLCRDYILPKFLLKRFNIYAWRNDEASFLDQLQDSGLRSSLLSSRKCFSQEPKVFLKVLMLFAFPRLCYKYRQKNIYTYKM